ncbi:unnamed protein product [Adineta steineri]|uniref:Uncharacterized protein n=1 Tax=Adineta steineri TaxID=433720 RepID=A0A815HQ43_9BILA|nr:unnamed protein product [Adineta steineri]
MELSLFYFTLFLCVLLSVADQAELNSCPTSRRLLFFDGFTFPLLGEKKVETVSSSSKSSPSSKNARTDKTHELTVYIQPQTSSELGQKVRSYSHLLKSKLFTKKERAKLRNLKLEKKKASLERSTKKKNTTQHATKTRDLVAVADDDHERDRCRALLHITHENSLIPAEDIKKTKKKKNSISSKVKNITGEAKKKLSTKVKSLPTNDKKKSKKEKTSKSNTKVVPDENKKKKPTIVKSSKTQSDADEIPQPTPPPIQRQTSSSPPPPTNTKTKREKSPPVIEIQSESLDMDIDNDNDKNNSVVGRAFYFVKNMFQLSDDVLDNNHTHDEDEILSSTNEQQHRPSRKLLSVGNDELNRYLNQLDIQDLLVLPFNDLSSSVAYISKRQLLSVKTSKHTTSSKEKKTNLDENKPKVGWNYRYRISRYLDDQKTKRTGHNNKGIGGGKSKQTTNSKQNNKKTSSASDTKITKRKLLELESDDDELSLIDNDISNQDIVDSVLITQDFVPKRQLLSSKKVKKTKVVKIEDDNDDNDAKSDDEKTSGRRRMKSFDELTNPAEIVRSYDRGLFKPRVGWQFRYRVSRYIDSLRENIREDEHRLKLGLQAIKRKTPQELSGRRKRVLDKPFASEVEETPEVTDENKPHVGWRYRYRVSKMLEAKKRGEYVDDNEEKRKARIEHKQKGTVKSASNDDDCIEWEHDSDPELRKIGEEGRHVGWAYRYRIRRRLDELKEKQAETGVPFNLETLGGKREKKVVTTTASPTVTSEEKPVEAERQSVGWEYRYRISKMREAQKHATGQKSTKSSSKKHDDVPTHEKVDPTLARLSPEERSVGWQYRYRIRRKLDALNDAAGHDTEGGKRGKKQKRPSSSKGKDKEKIIKQVEESIEKILNINDIDETPFMEYFRRASNHIFSALLPTGRKSVCLLPLPVTFSFCKEDDNDDIQEKLTKKSESHKQSPVKKLRTKKEKEAKQFIHSRSTKLNAVEEKIDDTHKPSLKTQTIAVEKPQKKQRSHPSIRRTDEEQIKHFDEEEHPVKKLVGVEAKKKSNRKKFQIIGQEVKIKNKPSTTPSVPVATTQSPPVVQTTPATPVTTTTTTTHRPATETTTSIPITTTARPPTIKTTPSPPPKTTTKPPTIVTTSRPIVEIPQTTPRTPEPEIITTTTTHLPPVQSIPEIVEEEAATLLSSAKSAHSDEVKEEINEANENAQGAASSPVVTDSSSSSSEEDSNSNESESDSSDSESSSSDSDNSSSSEETTDEDYDPAPIQKMKQFYENTKKSVHGVFDLKDDQDSS